MEVFGFFLALLQVTEKTDAYLDNLRVGLELWEKQLMLGGEVDNWAGAKLALFAESHPFHTEQHVLHMRVRPLCKAKCDTNFDTLVSISVPERHFLTF